jgi:bifunctional DNA-binding transcriptional regulator/antitoxin component of YhaV-PrlF toxin-antitoxin module
METISARISSKYQVVISRSVREALKLTPKDELLFLMDGETVTLLGRPANFTTAMRGLHKGLWSEAARQVEEERTTWES